MASCTRTIRRRRPTVACNGSTASRPCSRSAVARTRCSATSSASWATACRASRRYGEEFAMRLELTEEQEELRRAVRDFCAREVDPERLLAWEKDPRGLDDRIRDAVSELGWLGLGLPASGGGSGASL